MARDELYRVTWKPGGITVHASSPERAQKVALEYMQAKEMEFFLISLEPPKEPMP